MSKPYIICHMMTSLDGRIDCAMTENLPGVEDYYSTLSALDAPTSLSGRVTAQLEIATDGIFESKTKTPLGKTAFYKAVNAPGYEIVVDTHGTLRWDSRNDDKPLLVITSESAAQEYLAYLEELHISWVAAGQEHIDLDAACEILYSQFGVRRMAIVGGGHINGGFLAAGLINEISILIGAGIDGREGMTAVFDGLPQSSKVIPLHLKSVERMPSEAVWLRYTL